MKKYYERYKHIIPLALYGLIYGTWFAYLEKTVTRPENLIHMRIDDFIPFCEIFVVPYFLWFGYVAAAVMYLFFKDKQDYYKTCVFLFTGMTVFLLISTLWPNGHHLRPHVMPRENLFTAWVSHLYTIDTPTNLWPSIHVYNSIGAHLAIVKNAGLKKHKWLCGGSFILCVSIILSTVFIKQHSVFDMLTAFIMAGIMYVAVYGMDIVAAFQEKRFRHSSERGRIRQV